MTLVDTDVLIWNLRGNERAADRLDAARAFYLSAVSYMELVQGVRDKSELRVLRQALHYWSASILHINDGISSRASFLMEEHSLGDGMQLADALIAATALEYGLELLTANDKHYGPVEGLEVSVFRP